MAGIAVLYQAGAIVSGGIFGDNLAPVSDTTICSATTQGADVGGVLVNGIAGMVDICILALLILSCVHIIKVGQGDKKLLQLAKKFVHSVRGVEASIAALAISLSAIMVLQMNHLY